MGNICCCEQESIKYNTNTLNTQINTIFIRYNNNKTILPTIPEETPIETNTETKTEY